MAKSFNNLQSKMSLQSQETSKQILMELKYEIMLAELRNMSKLNLDKINKLNKLDYNKLSSEKRYGIIEFDVELLFDLYPLKDYIIPLGIRLIKEKLTYELFCLSPKFDRLETIRYSKDVPNYLVYFERDKFGQSKLKEIKRL